MFPGVMASHQPILLSRDAFRAAVLDRDKHRCVICGISEAERHLSAHHIIERRLWPNGGYFVANGASLCDHGAPEDYDPASPDPDSVGCHLKAEMTLISPEEIRAAAGITEMLLPDQFTDGEKIDKWGNPVLGSGQRSKGELFNEEPVQKMLAAGGVLDLFVDRIRYPRTYHHPTSPGAGSDDSYIQNLDAFAGHEVVVSHKLDGENSTWARDYIHARSLDSGYHPSRTRVRAMHAAVRYDIPEGWRICGENMQVTHAIKYRNLPGPFIVFAVYDDNNTCLSWDETVEWAELLGLPTVPLLYRGVYDEEKILSLVDTPPPGWADQAEGIVCRRADKIAYRDWRRMAFKWVRKDHVQPNEGHWMSRTTFEENQILP